MEHGVGEPGRSDDLLSDQIIGACIEIHRCLGPELLTYLKLTNCEVGLLINFNVPLLKLGIRRLTHQKICAPRLPGSL